MILIQLSDRTLFSDKEDMYRVRPGFNSLALRQPPAIRRAYASTNMAHGRHVTPMHKYGWDEYLRKLNGRKFKLSADPKLAMFNGQGWPNMHSLFFAGNFLRAVPVVGKPGWMRIVTLDYLAGPPDDMPTFDVNPIFVMEFTLKGRLTQKLSTRNFGRLYYPVVSRYPVYMPSSFLEPWSLDMEVRMPT